VAGAGLASCLAIGGAMTKEDEPGKEQGKEPTQKGSGKDGFAISDEEIKKTMLEIFGPGGGAEFRDAPWQLLRKATNYTTFRCLARMVKLFDVHFERGNLPALKMLFDLVALFEKNGSVQPGEMQSFAELLIQSLEAETPIDLKPGDAERIGPNAE
jgi:hypothetical protein